MDILLDTHVIIWALSAPNRIPPQIQNIIVSADNRIFYSLASVWEVAIKHKKNPAYMPLPPREFTEAADMAGYTMLDITPEAIIAAQELERDEWAPPHNDPFDKVMIAQAKTRINTKFITHDSLIPYYHEPSVICF